MKKKLSMMLAVLLLTGCVSEPQKVESETTDIPKYEEAEAIEVESNSESDDTPPQDTEEKTLTAAETPPAEYMPGHESRLYRYEPETETFNVEEFFDRESNTTYGDLAELVAEKLSLPQPEYYSMTVDFSTLIVDWSQDYSDKLNQSGMKEIFLQSYAMTLSRLTAVREFRSMTAGKTEDFQLKELKLNGWNEAAYKELRASIPYEEPYYWSEYEYCFAEQFPVDEQGWQIARIAEYIGIVPYPVEGELFQLQEDILSNALFNTEAVSVLDYPDENYHPQALPIAIAVDDTMFYFKEHVEATAKWILGPDTVIEHQPINKFAWFEEAGAYRPPHMNFGRAPAVALLSYQDKGDRVEAIVVGVDHEYYGDGFVDVGGNTIQSENLKDVIENQLPHYKLTLRKGGASGLYFESLVHIG